MTKQEEIFTAQDAFELADLTFANEVYGIPDNLILSTDKKKIHAHIKELIKEKAMWSEFYLTVMVYGEKQKKAFMDVAQSLKEKEKFSFVVINGTKPDSIMCVIISWKNIKDKEYKPHIKYAKINI